MIITKLVLYKSVTNKDNTHPIRIYFSVRRKAYYIGTQVSLSEKDWKNLYVKPTSELRATQKILELKVSKIDKILFNLEATEELYDLTPTQLMDRLLGRTPKDLVTNEVETLFIDVRASKDKPKTQSAYTQALTLLERYTDLSTLCWSDITYKFLKGWETKLLQTRNANGASVPLRTFRAVYYEAIRRGLVQGQNVFNQFKIKKIETQHRALTVGELRQLKGELPDPNHQKYVDIFFLSFYLLGINMVDLLTLKQENLHDGRIEFSRSKTSKPFSIRIEPEAQKIFDKYKGENYLLDILDRYNGYEYFIRNMNDALQLVGTEHKKGCKRTGKPWFPDLSSYWARHTWATLAADLDINESTISHALGHSSGNRTTAIYIRPNQKKVDIANRRVIDYLNSDEVIEW